MPQMQPRTSTGFFDEEMADIEQPQAMGFGAPQQEPQGFGQRIGQGVADNSAMMMALGGQMMAHRQNANNPMFDAGNMVKASALDQGRVKQRKDEEEEKRKQSRSMGWLKTNFGISDDDAMAAMGTPEIMNHYLKLAQGEKRERGRLVPVDGGYLYDEDTGQFIASPGAQQAQQAEYPEGLVTPKARERYDTEMGEQAAAGVKQQQGAQLYLGKVDRLIAEIDGAGDDAFGPIQGGDGLAGRMYRRAAAMAGSDTESKRQQLEAKYRELELAVAAMYLKGDGPITESERAIAREMIGGLANVNSATAKQILENLKVEANGILGIQPEEPGAAAGGAGQFEGQTSTGRRFRKVAD